MKMMKSFFYQFNDPYFSNEIQVDINECQTVNQLKKKIATFFHIFDYRKIIIDNLPKETQLEQITEKFIFNLKFPRRSNNITFSLPDHIQVCIKNGYKMSRNEIIASFRDNHLYYSNECINNYFHFKIYKEELPQIEFPFLAIPPDVWVYVEMGCNIVSLKYDDKKFFFSENESSSEAYKLIKENYQRCESVLIQSSESILNYTDKLKRFTPYDVKVIYKITFKNIESRIEFVLNLDFLSKISDARKELFERYCKKDVDHQEDIIMYNGNMKRIEDYSKLLKDTQNFEIYFYFEYNNNIIRKSPTSESKVSYKNKIKRTSEIDSKFTYYPQTPTKEPIRQTPSPEKQQKYIFDYKSPKSRFRFSSTRNSSDKNSSLSITNTKLNSSQINSELNSTKIVFSTSPIRESNNYSPQNQSFTPKNQSFTPKNQTFTPKNQSFTPKNQSFTPKNQTFTPKNQSLTQKSQTFTPKKQTFSPKNQSSSPENEIKYVFDYKSPMNNDDKISPNSINKSSDQKKIESKSKNDQKHFTEFSNQNNQQKIDLNFDNNEYDNYYDDDFQINFSSDNQANEKESKKGQNLTNNNSKSKEKFSFFEEEEEEIDFDNKNDDLKNNTNENQNEEIELNSKNNFDGDKQNVNDLDEVENLPNLGISSVNEEEEELSNSLKMDSDIYKFLEEED